MINKRLLIKNIISHNDECSFYDKKESIDLTSNSGKEKFLKHVAALSNSNPENDSFLLVGISDSNEIKGENMIDDADIQNIISSSLSNPPRVKYENIAFPNLSKDKAIGLLTISESKTTTFFSRTIDKIAKGTIYHRVGSKSVPTENIQTYPENKEIVKSTYKYSSVSIKELIDGVFEFINSTDKEYNPQYYVFKEQFVICFSGYGLYPNFSEVDVRIINEEVRLFFSAIKDVQIEISDNEFKILQFQSLGFDDKINDYPHEITTISFYENGTYYVQKNFVFEPPIFEATEIQELYNRSKALERKILAKEKLTQSESEFWEGIANYFFICYFNGIEAAKIDFYNSRNYIDGAAGLWHTECKTILEEYEKKYL